MKPSLTLSRPLVALDLETTGLDVDSDRIVEIACIKLLPDGPQQELCYRCNPQRPIAPQATAVHGITDAAVADAPPFAARAAELQRFLQGADLTGFNIERFDLPLLRREFTRVGVEPTDLGDVRVIDSMRIYMRQEPRDLTAAYRFYCQRELQQAHSAAADARAAVAVLQAQVMHYPDLPTDVAGLDSFCHQSNPDFIDRDGKLIWVDGKAALGFGKFRHRSLEALAADNPDYLRWVMGANFPPEVVKVIADTLAGRPLRR